MTTSDEECPSSTAGALNDLAVSTPELARSIDTLARRYRTSRILAWVSTAAATIATVAVIVLLLLYQQVRHTQDQTTAVRQRVLCPLYTILLAATEAPPPPGPVDPRHTEAVDVIKEGYAALGCADIRLQPPPGAASHH